MQGYLQITSFGVPPINGEPDELAVVDYIVISRRSRDRAGLRYQRRGVGEEGNVANFVETESIARVQARWFPFIELHVQLSFIFAAGGFEKRFQLCPTQGFKCVVMLLRASWADRLFLSSTLLDPVRVWAQARSPALRGTDACATLGGLT